MTLPCQDPEHNLQLVRRLVEEGSESLCSVSVSDTEVSAGVGSDRIVGVRTSGSALESGLSLGAGVSSF